MTIHETNNSPAPSTSTCKERLLLPRSAAAPAKTRTFFIYVVDDEPQLTGLYTVALEAMGCLVRAFTDRVQAVDALHADVTKPDLLITDFVNASMAVDDFVQACRRIHPALRILIVSGFSQANTWLSRERCDRFLGKPFTQEEFRREVRAALQEDSTNNPLWPLGLNQ